MSWNIERHRDDQENDLSRERPNASPSCADLQILITETEISKGITAISLLVHNYSRCGGTMTKVSHLHRAFILLFLTTLSGLVYGQTTGSFLGIVTDSSGASIAGAYVTITETRTNTERVITTDAAGRFVANALQTGT